MHEKLNEHEVNALLEQILFFNSNFHQSENNENLKAFNKLMRDSKDRCQLLLIKFSPPHLISVYRDLNSLGGEWIISSSTGKMGTHIPLDTLLNNLSNDLLKFWNIN